MRVCAPSHKSFKTQLKKLFKDVEDVDAADAVQKILKSKEVTTDGAVAEFAAAFLISKALEKAVAARDRKTLYAVLKGLVKARAAVCVHCVCPLLLCHACCALTDVLTRSTCTCTGAERVSSAQQCRRHWPLH